MRKILFLDIDGVLNPKWWVQKPSVDRYGCAFSRKCVANLAKILKDTSAEIVVSSSWKCMGLTGLQAMWKDRNLPGKVVDVTPDYLSDEMLQNSAFNNDDVLYHRGCEIKGWLSLHGEGVSNYAIIDDMDDMLPEQLQHFVWTNEEFGLTEGDAAQAIMVLNHLHV